jgi:hypothetical protein
MLERMAGNHEGSAEAARKMGHDPGPLLAQAKNLRRCADLIDWMGARAPRLIELMEPVRREARYGGGWT